MYTRYVAISWDPDDPPREETQVDADEFLSKFLADTGNARASVRFMPSQRGVQVKNRDEGGEVIKEINYWANDQRRADWLLRLGQYMTIDFRVGVVDHAEHMRRAGYLPSYGALNYVTGDDRPRGALVVATNLYRWCWQNQPLEEKLRTTDWNDFVTAAAFYFEGEADDADLVRLLQLPLGQIQVT